MIQLFWLKMKQILLRSSMTQTLFQPTRSRMSRINFNTNQDDNDYPYKTTKDDQSDERQRKGAFRNVDSRFRKIILNRFIDSLFPLTARQRKLFLLMDLMELIKGFRRINRIVEWVRLQYMIMHSSINYQVRLVNQDRSSSVNTKRPKYRL